MNRLGIRFGIAGKHGFVTLIASGCFALALMAAPARAANPVHVERLSVGSNHSCATLPSGQAACWGENSLSQLGDGTTGNRTVPTPVSGLTDAIAVSAALFHACAIRGTGQALCWGYNTGQLGDGTETSRPTPFPVSGLTDATAISAGHLHTCAIDESKQALCWGFNGSGQLGDGTHTDAAEPVPVDGLTDAVAISAGGQTATLFGNASHTCAIDESKQALCWGGNGFLQLGDGSASDRSTPTPVSGLTDAVAISAGSRHTCAIEESGQAVCWGYNPFGQLGDGTDEDRSTPTPVSGLTDAVAISAGSDHTCAIRESGQAVCWGRNVNGVLGDGSTFSSSTPLAVSGLADAIAIGAGYLHSCGVRASGEALCWGSNFCGQLGDGTYANRYFPAPVLDTAQFQFADCDFDQELPIEEEPIVKPTPKRGNTVIATVVRGKVRIRTPGARRYRPLNGSERIPIGSYLNTRRGRVQIVPYSNRTSGTRSAEFYGGIFRVLQRKKVGEIQAHLAGGLACSRKAKGPRKARGRLLWGEGGERYVSVGSRSSASVPVKAARNTRWLVWDRCDGSTLTRVAKGRVSVRDLVRKRTVQLRKGGRYVAAPRKGARR